MHKKSSLRCFTHFKQKRKIMTFSQSSYCRKRLPFTFHTFKRLSLACSQFHEESPAFFFHTPSACLSLTNTFFLVQKQELNGTNTLILQVKLQFLDLSIVFVVVLHGQYLLYFLILLVSFIIKVVYHCWSFWWAET